MPPTKALVKAQPQAVVADITDAELAVLRDALNPDLNPAELKMFGLVAKRSGLDPFARQIYAIRRDGKMRFEASIDGFRLIAERSGKYDGQDAPIFEEPCPCGELPKGHPLKAVVLVYRKDWTRPAVGEAFWHEYVALVPISRDDPRQGKKPGPMWMKMPHNQLAKCAESLALRKAFPNDLSGIYTAEEMEQSDGNQPASAAPVVGAGGAGAGQEPAGEGGATPALAAGSAPSETVIVHELMPEPEAFEGSVIAPLPDRVREVKRPEWLHTLPPEATVAKTELKFVVGRTKHTAVLLGQWAYAVQAAELAAGDTVRVKGERIEVMWQTGMPTKKELRFVTSVEVLRDGAWQLLTSPQEALPLAPAAEGDTQDVPADTMQAPPAQSDSGSVATSAVEGDFTQAVEEVFGTDAVPARPLEELLKLPLATGSGEANLGLTWLTSEDKVTAETKKAYADIRLTDGKLLYRGVMEGSEAEAQLLVNGEPRYAEGEQVRVVGMWHGSGRFILLTAVTEA